MCKNTTKRARTYDKKFKYEAIDVFSAANLQQKNRILPNLFGRKLYQNISG